MAGGIEFDWTFRVGDILTIGGAAAVAITFAFRSGKVYQAITMMQGEIKALKEVAAQIGGVLTMVATQKVEIDHIKEDVRELKHGDGFIGVQVHKQAHG